MRECAGHPRSKIYIVIYNSNDPCASFVVGNWKSKLEEDSIGFCSRFGRGGWKLVNLIIFGKSRETLELNYRLGIY